MKKFLKVLLIIILICASVGGTAYFFYKKLNPKVNYFIELNSYTQTWANEEFTKNLAEVYTKTSAVSVGSNRFSLIVETNEKLNSCLDSLSSYFVVSDNYKIDENKIEKGLSGLKSVRSETNRIMQAYLAKTEAQLRPSDATPSYVAFTNYFVKFSEFINLINAELNSFNIDKAADLKFSIIELYCNVCIDTFTNLNLANTEVRDSTNINLINQHLNFKNSYLDLGDNTFSYLNNSFIKYYNLCNKVNFAKNLSANLNNGNLGSSENELLAGYYLNLIFGE